jgi:hypothetical protein
MRMFVKPRILSQYRCTMKNKQSRFAFSILAPSAPVSVDVTSPSLTTQGKLLGGILNRGVTREAKGGPSWVSD